MGRKAAEKEALAGLSLIDPSGKSTELYLEIFSRMDDKQFRKFIQAIKDKRASLSVNVENLTGSKITTDNNLKIAPKLGVEFFQRVWVTDPVTGAVMLTNHKYLILTLAIRRQIQTLDNKISLAEDNTHVDDLTDQPTGVSKGSGISLPEILIMNAQGNQKAIEELAWARGGNLKVFNVMNRQIHQTGHVSLSALNQVGTRAKVADTVSKILTAMHYRNNF